MLKIQKWHQAPIYLFLLTLISVLVFSTTGDAQWRKGPGCPSDKWFQNHDVNRDGAITFDEFTSKPPDRERRTPEEIFAHLDANGDGNVTFDEFQSGRPDRPDRPGGEEHTPQDMFDRLDTNGNGRVTLDEFQSGRPDRPERGGPTPQDMFDRMDTNGDGAIQLEEAQAAHRERERNRQMRFKQSDTSGDGKLSFEEFQACREPRHDEMAEKFFKRADSNGDGYLQQEELEAMHAQMKRRHGGERHGEKPIEEKDFDGDGKLSLVEFKTGMAQRMFQRIDADGDGYVELAELEAMGGPRHEASRRDRADVPTETETMGDSPAGLTSVTLDPAYPNPFNPTTSLKLSLQEAAFVTLSVYDITGRLVQTLHRGSLSPGTYSFAFDGTRLASGVYFVELRAGEAVSIQKMMLSK
ncbi:MAG: EF-hand domain-containing protein [bacterium]